MLEQAIYSHLVATMGNNKVYPTVFPDNVAMPAILYQRITGTPSVTHSGDGAVEGAQFQISCFAKTFANAVSLAEAVKAAFSAYSGPMGDLPDVRTLVVNEIALYEAEARLHHIVVDVDILAKLS